MTAYIQVMTTTDGKESAQAIAHALVEGRLAACVQVLGPITSTYRWKEGIERTEEWLCLVKSTADRYEEMERTIRKIHPYEVPEILAMPVAAGDASYLAWLREQVTAREE